MKEIDRKGKGNSYKRNSRTVGFVADNFIARSLGRTDKVEWFWCAEGVTEHRKGAGECLKPSEPFDTREEAEAALEKHLRW